MPRMVIKHFLYNLAVYPKSIYICGINTRIMKTVLLKLDDAIFGDTEDILSRIKKPRNRYINEAIEYYNKYQKRQILEKRLKSESELVSEESLSVLKEFEEVDNDH